jgi:excisionase family DNA binding protein
MKEYLSTEELCKYLDVSKAYVYMLSHKNELPKYCPSGKRIWFKKSDVDNFINKGRISSNDEIQEDAELRLYKERRTK